MKKLLVMLLMTMTCISMSGFAPSFVTALNQKEVAHVTTDQKIAEKTNTFDQLKKSVYTYLNLPENPYENQQDTPKNLPSHGSAPQATSSNGGSG